MDEKMRKGQVAIWVILGVVLFASVLLFVLLGQRVGEPDVPGRVGKDTVFDMQSFLDECTEQYVLEAVGMMLPRGGFVEPKNFVLFNNTEISSTVPTPIEYSCKNRGFYDPCVPQHLTLINDMEREVEDYILPRLVDCFDDMKREFGNRNGVLSSEPGLGLRVDFVLDEIRVNIKKEVTITKNEETRKFSEFDVRVQSPVYNLADIAREAEYCYFEYVGYSILYPRYEIRKKVMSDPVKIYTIEDLKSGEKMNIAIRGCAIPAGI